MTMLRLWTILSLCAATTQAWSTGSAVSSFGGSVLVTAERPTTPAASSSSSWLDMKKGKANVPPQMRGQYAQQQRMLQMREQMLAASTPGDDGFPVFNLFVRTKKANMWYPCGSFKGDERSASLAKSWSNGGMLSGVSKKHMDAGIAGSLYRDVEKLKESVVRAYPQLKKSRKEFEFGYKLAYDGLPEDKAKEIFVVEPKEQKGVFDGVKNLFS